MATLIQNVNAVAQASADIVAAMGNAGFTLTEGLSTYGEQIGQKLGDFKDDLRDATNISGVSIVDDTTPLAGYPTALQEYFEAQAENSHQAVVAVSINPAESEYYLPEDQTGILNGAKIIATNISSGESIEQAVADLTDATYALRFSNMDAPAKIRVSLSLGNKTYRAVDVVATANGGQATYVTLTTHPNMGKVEVGRVQRFSDTSGFSFLIRRVTDDDGTQHLYYGGFTESVSNSGWVDNSGVRVTVHNRPTPTEAEPNPVTTEVVLAGAGTGAVNIVDMLDCLKDMDEITVDYLTTTPITGNKFMRYKPVYVKTERTTLNIPVYASDGSVASTSDYDVVIKWMCNEQADSAYHLHPLFERYVRNQETDEITVVPLEYGYIARYPIKFVSATYNGSGSFNVATSKPDGSREVGATRINFLNACRKLNEVPIKVTLPDGTETTYEANTDARRWSMCAHGADISFLQWVAYLMYGNDVQAKLTGICTTAVASSSNGVTDSLFNEGIMFGSLGAGATGNLSNQHAIIFCGIEDALWSSTGWMTADLTFYANREPNKEDGSAGATSQYLTYARDRLDYAPEANEPNRVGYTRLAFNTTGNTRIGYDPALGARDLMVFGATNAADPLQDNIRVAGVDAAWLGGAPAASASGGHSAFMVALGRSRFNGSSLGAFYLSADAALTYSDGTYWRARASLQLVATGAIA